jgi:hypothetical protein
MLRKLVPFVALALAAAACSADQVTGPAAQQHAATPTDARNGSGMMGGGG